MSDEFMVLGDGLNLREGPGTNTLVVAPLPGGQRVIRLSNSGDPGWWRISTVLDGHPLEGFVANSHLQEATAPYPVPPVHRAATARRSQPANQTGDKPLGESGQPVRTAADSKGKVEQLRNIITWLDVEHEARYEATGGATYCNIYAYDYCFLADAYLPRVWWTDSAVNQWKSGKTVPVSGATTEEKTANQLFGWLQKFGPEYGWVRTDSLTELQERANKGQVGIICAKRKPGHHGHIVAVVPESEKFHAVREGGAVTRPLQSQASDAGFNFSYRARPDAWWRASVVEGFGFWYHP